MLGHKLLHMLREEFEHVAGLAYENVQSPPYAQIPILQGNSVRGRVDAADFPHLIQLLEQERPDYILNAVGIIPQRDYAMSPLRCIELNSLLPHKLAQAAQAWGGRVIHFSTDCVFDGRRGAYSEQDEPTANDLYGRTKYLGEVQYDNALTLRTSIIGRELTHHRSLLDWFLGQRGKKVKGYARVIYSGVTTNQMAKVVAMLISRYPRISGLYQVVARPISKFDLLSLIRDTYGLNIEIEREEHTRSDRSMKGDKLREATGYISPSWPELVADLASDSTPYSDWGVCP